MITDYVGTIGITSDCPEQTMVIFPKRSYVEARAFSLLSSSGRNPTMYSQWAYLYSSSELLVRAKRSREPPLPGGGFQSMSSRSFLSESFEVLIKNSEIFVRLRIYNFKFEAQVNQKLQLILKFFDLHKSLVPRGCS